MIDTYLLETMMREHMAKLQRQAPLQAALHELERSRRRNETLVARLRRAVITLLPIRCGERTATR